MEESKSEDSGTSLRYVFAVSQKQFEDIEKSSSSSTELQPKIRECITKLRLAKELVFRNALFSPNEELDDVPTSSLRLLILLLPLMRKIYLSRLLSWSFIHSNIYSRRTSSRIKISEGMKQCDSTNT